MKVLRAGPLLEPAFQRTESAQPFESPPSTVSSGVFDAGPAWKGYLKLSLVSCPVALYPATSASERVSFRQINKRTGNRVRHQLVDAVTGEAIEPHDKGRGYEIGENEFLVIEDHELAAAREEARAAEPRAPSGEPPREREDQARGGERQVVRPATPQKI